MVISPRVLKVALVVAIVLSLVRLIAQSCRRNRWGSAGGWGAKPWNVRPYERFEDEAAEDEYEDEPAEDEYEDEPAEDEYYEDEPAEDEYYEDEYEDGMVEGFVEPPVAPDMLNVATDLLPKPTVADPAFAEFAPKALLGQNFLDTKKYIGVDTKGSSLRNPSYDLRSTPSIPRKDVGPWAMSTIDNDLYRKPLE